MANDMFVTLQKGLPKQVISRTVGWLTELHGGPLTRVAIRLFIAFFKVDMSDAERPEVNAYPTFNAFFTRALAEGARPSSDDPTNVACPADGTVSQIGTLDDNRLLQAKGIDYRLEDLLAGDTKWVQRYRGGNFATIYLAPYNYHRVHMPTNGQPEAMMHIPGALFSVNQQTVAGLPNLFCRNERVVMHFATGRHFFAMIMVGALNVGSIALTLPTPTPFRNRTGSTYASGMTVDITERMMVRGEEFGRFNMGSTVIVLTSPELVAWDDNTVCGKSVRVNETIGHLTGTG